MFETFRRCKDKRPFSRIQAENIVLNKALKFDENDLIRKELAKARQLLEDSKLG